MKLKTKKYKAILSVSILTILGTSGIIINNSKSIEKETYSSKQIEQVALGRHHSAAIDYKGNL